MANQSFDPMKAVQKLGDSVNRLAEDFFATASGTQSVPLDIYETAESVVIKAGPLVGAQPEEIDISITGGALTIKGETRPEDDVAGATYLRRERKYGPFSRTVNIPIPVKPDQAAADFKDWMLIITLPKAEEAKPRTINIETPAKPSTGAAL
jgi:HSP20 family protein